MTTSVVIMVPEGQEGSKPVQVRIVSAGAQPEDFTAVPLQPGGSQYFYVDSSQVLSVVEVE